MHLLPFFLFSKERLSQNLAKRISLGEHITTGDTVQGNNDQMFEILSKNNITAQNSVHNDSGTAIGSKSTNINASFQSFQVDNNAAVKVKKAKKASGNKKQSSKKGQSATIPVLPILTSTN